MSNSAITCQEWRIADVNRDGTSGTVDLFPKYVLSNGYIAFSTGTKYYASSSLRTYLNTTVLNGFTAEIQNAMKVQAFPSNGETLYDKVKCPSLNEVGVSVTNDNSVVIEGYPYPIFGGPSCPNANATFKLPNGSGIGAIYTWTRTCDTIGNVYLLSYNGRWLGGGASQAFSVIACIRF